MNKKEILFGLTVALFLALLISPFASSWPDGLEKVAEDKGFLELGEVEPILSSPIPDYQWPGLNNEGFATASAGLAGVLITFGVVYGVVGLLKKPKTL